MDSILISTDHTFLVSSIHSSTALNSGDPFGKYTTLNTSFLSVRSKRDSGDAHRNGGHITRQGSKWLRYTIVEAANTSTRCDDRIERFYKRIAERRGPQKARVADCQGNACNNMVHAYKK